MEKLKLLYGEAWRGREFDDSPTELVLGEETRRLERSLASWVGAEHCVAVSDPVSGIALALKAAGVNSGDRVICPALGCALPVQGVLLAGGIPLFADVNPDTYTLDPFQLEYTLDKMRGEGEGVPSALIASDLFGGPCQLIELEQICESHGVTLIEDMSEAFGAEYLGRKVGSFVRFSVASFATNSLWDEPGGGAIFCRDEEDAVRVAALRRQCREQSLQPRSRIPYMRSADVTLTHARLESFEQEQAGRQKAALRYHANLEGKVQFQQLIEGGESVHSQLVVTLPDQRRGEVIQRLIGMGIPCNLPHCGIQTLSGYDSGELLANASILAGRLLCLPIYSHLNVKVVDFVCEGLLEALGQRI
ncbi:MAG: DegT/DnrJ/EryC1/StrS aminotransferase family protein [Oscillospiraceae bacterium]|nr:DegT/DnrJ/EryC1/StrS aminotransferase family protein [Oscillospiraceae bacterium]